jgi:hypothetical protein
MKTVSVEVSTVKSITSNNHTESSQIDADVLLKKAHTVLLRYLPGATLPVDLAKVRAMLDSHMFGLSKKVHRDSVLEVARQIDQVLPASVRLPQRRAK